VNPRERDISILVYWCGGDNGKDRRCAGRHENAECRDGKRKERVDTLSSLGQSEPMIDAHCHLADHAFSSDLPAVLARAAAAGVRRFVCISDTLQEAKSAQELAEKYEQIFYTVGIHPHHATLWNAGVQQQMHTMLKASPKMVAVGEIGLDYHSMRSPKDMQQRAFREQLLIAKAVNLPTVVHCREAVADVWSIIEEVRPPKIQLHCCTEAWEDVHRFLERGDMLSFTGICTYPNAGVIRETIARCPLASMMLETDSPYLAPVPHRGKRNEPSYVLEVARCVATIKGVPIEEVDRVTTENTEEFFALQKKLP